jgi:hypothetical protein
VRSLKTPTTGFRVFVHMQLAIACAGSR